jgi:large subunit ribosomal protein L6
MVSRVAKHPIHIPSGVEVRLDGRLVSIKGKLGALKQEINDNVKVTFADNTLSFAPANDALQSNALAGTSRALVNNMVKGVTEGFSCKLVLVGVGYRAKAQGKVLNLTVGMSHPVNVTMPEGVTVDTPTQTEIILKGADKAVVQQVAANIRDIRPPEPYKGKGIRYENERIVLKEAKKK